MPDLPSLSLRIAAFELPSISTASFTVQHEIRGEAVIVMLRGNADSDVAGTLSRYLERLHEEMCKARLQEVTLDCRELYFLTASCINCLVDAIKRLAALDARSQYKINLIRAPALRWQERSFEVLCRLAPVVVRMRSD